MIASAIDTVAAIIAGLLIPIIGFGLICLGAAAGMKVAELTRSNIYGWLVGGPLALLLLVGAVPIIDALQGVVCKNSDDFEACLEDDRADP